MNNGKVDSTQITAVELKVFHVGTHDQYWITYGAQFGSEVKVGMGKDWQDLDERSKVVTEKLARKVATEGRCPNLVWGSHVVGDVFFVFRVTPKDLDEAMKDGNPIEKVDEVDPTAQVVKVKNLGWLYKNRPVGFRLKRFLGGTWPFVLA